jgi:AcrR family transcriptional regulator
MPRTRRTAATATTRAKRSGSTPKREPLSRERILRAAIDEVREVGLAALSTRRLGQRLHCEAMSIYHHFPSKAHLLDAMVDHAIESIEQPPAGLNPMQRMRHALHSYRAMANRFPALYPLVAVHRLNTPCGVRYIESILVMVRAAVPDDELAARHFRTVGYYLTGASLDETSGYAKGPSAAQPVSDDYIREHCPTLMKAAPYFKASQWDRTFELGLEAMLDAMARDAEAIAQHATRR